MLSYKFSVVVPVYNVEKYLDECVQSILGQSYTNFELILVNDGSEDSSPKICDKYAQLDSRVRVFHKRNGGQADARNVGTQHASGDYIVYIDSDDYLCDREFLQKINEKANTKVDVICYKFKKYYDDQKRMGECSFSCPDIDSIATLASRVNEMVRRDAFYCSPWSKAIRLSIIRENGIHFEKGLLSEDQEWFYYILIKIRSIAYINEAFLVYRQRANSTTSSFKLKNLTDCIYVVNKWFRQIPQEEIDEEYKRALLNSVAKLYCNLLIAYTRFQDSRKKEYYSVILQMKDLLRFHENPRVNVFYKVCRLVGFRGLIFALKIVCKLR